MRRLFHILLFLCGLLLYRPVAFCAAPVPDGNPWDAALDRYERICDRCLALRQRSLSGEEVSMEELSGLLVQLSDLRAVLQQGSGKMSPAQQERFSRIKRRYLLSLRNRDPMAPVPSLALAAAPPGRVRTTLPPACPAGLSMVEPGYVLHQCPTGVIHLASSAIVLGGLSFSDAPGVDALSGGLMLCKRFPAGFSLFLKGRSNFRFLSPDGRCFSDGTSESGGPVWTSGASRRSASAFSAGVGKWLGSRTMLDVGAGYGWDTLCWEDATGRWLKVTDASRRGLCLNAGILRQGRRTCFANDVPVYYLGGELLDFRIFTFEFGVGFAF
ncbi:MAG: hypothetical protein J6O01_02255 [Bacteroidales bacterium]|nr:hypothetical protein [Bacteroidales bacterium]